MISGVYFPFLTQGKTAQQTLCRSPINFYLFYTAQEGQFLSNEHLRPVVAAFYISYADLRIRGVQNIGAVSA